MQGEFSSKASVLVSRQLQLSEGENTEYNFKVFETYGTHDLRILCESMCGPNRPNALVEREEERLVVKDLFDPVLGTSDPGLCRGIDDLDLHDQAWIRCFSQRVSGPICRTLQCPTCK